MRSPLPAVLAVLAASTAMANPTRAECKSYSSVVSELRHAKAAPFCSSYLHIKCSTTTTTCTTPMTTTVTVTPTTATVNVKDPTLTITITASPTSTTVTLPTSDCGNLPATPVLIGTGPPNAGRAQVRREAAAAAAAAAAAHIIPTPRCLKGYKPSKISSACRCMDPATRTEAVTAHKHSIVTNTITRGTAATVTTLDTTAVTVTTTYATYSCACTDASGWEYGFWVNPFSYEGAEGPFSDQRYMDFQPTAFKTTPPYASGTTVQQSGSYNADLGEGETVYGQTDQDPAHLVINQRGYFKAPTTDDYTFRLQDHADDIQLLWLDTKATSGWDRDNADQTSWIVRGTTAPVTIHLDKGDYIAVRFMFGQDGGPATWGLTVTNSAGLDVTPGTFVQSNCNPATYDTQGGRPYDMVFGNET